ncbi:MAG: hypothetical protein JXB05_15855 [Myxococcaceae bacterium]|nr:hypothetical protein [Myxococcaceae bacterium]
MANPKNASTGLNPEPPELGAERERLLAELEKGAKTYTGTTQAVLRKLHEVVTQTRPEVPTNFQLYVDARLAIERFAKDPVLPPPPVIMQTVEFMQKRAVMMGWTGKMNLPKGAPPPPPGLVGSAGPTPAVAAPANAAPRAAAQAPKDGFEGAARPQVALNPAGGAPVAAKPDQPERIMNPGAGNLKG